MAEARLYCGQCGRDYPFQGSLEGRQLFCAACAAPLADSPPPGYVRPHWTARLWPKPRDPFMGKVIGGARLTKLLNVRPTRRTYRAAHKQLRAEVRVEVFETGFVERNADYVGRLFEEAAATQEVRSLHVTTLLNLGRRRDCAFILCDFHPSSLRALLEAKGRLDINRTLALAEEVLHGLAAVDAAGATHGNVSPDGVLLGYDGLARLDHLGTALRAEDTERLTVTPAGAVRGPALYTAPEKLQPQRPPDVRADLYSLGVTIFEMLSGRPPYEGASGRQVLLKHLHEPVPDLHQARPDVPPELSRFVSRLMAKDPAGRPQKPQQALDELRECAVALSREGLIGPVRAAVTPGQHRRATLKWAAVWSLLAVALAALAIIPLALMYRQRQAGQAQTQEAAGAHTVLVMLRQSDPVLKDDLSAEEALGVSTLLDYRLAFYPELSAIRPAAGLEPGGGDLGDALAKAGAGNAFMAMHAAGFKRRNWTLVFSSRGKPPWSARADCAVEAEGPGSLNALETAADEVLAQAAGRLKLEPAAAGRPATGANVAAWALMGRALRAEREDRWDEALALSRQATQEVPEARPPSGRSPFAVLRAFYETVEGTQRTGRLTPAPLPQGGADAAGPAQTDAGVVALPPELAGLSAALESMGKDARPDVERQLARHLARWPSSARGYFLLGLWRLYGGRQADEAAVAFRHAAGLDPGYVPPARGYVQLMAPERPAEVRSFLDQMRQQAPDSEAVRRLEELARGLMPQGDADSPQ
jgi:hypothetical protein